MMKEILSNLLLIAFISVVVGFSVMVWKEALKEIPIKKKPNKKPRFEVVKEESGEDIKLGGINRKSPEELNKPVSLKQAEDITSEIIERDIGEDVLLGL